MKNIVRIKQDNEAAAESLIKRMSAPLDDSGVRFVQRGSEVTVVAQHDLIVGLSNAIFAVYKIGGRIIGKLVARHPDTARPGKSGASVSSLNEPRRAHHNHSGEFRKAA